LIPDAWEYDGTGRSWLPPDLTRGPGVCAAAWRRWLCTRQRGHGGRHAAGTRQIIAAVWRHEDDVPGQQALPQPQEVPC
jgi:hypothetical protein